MEIGILGDGANGCNRPFGRYGLPSPKRVYMLAFSVHMLVFR